MRYVTFLFAVWAVLLGTAHASSTITTAVFAASMAQAALPSGAQLTVTASPNTVLADNSAISSIAVQLLDGGGAPLPGQAIVLSVTGSSNRFGSATGVTDGLGRYSTSLRSSQSGMKTVTATASDRTACAIVTFVAGAPETNKSVVQVAPGYALVADGNAQFSFVAKIFDAFGNPVPNFALTPTSSNANGLFSPSSGFTASDGTFTTIYSSTRSGKQNVFFPVGARQLNSGATFYGGAPDAAATSFTLLPNTALQADGNDAFTLKVSLRDKFGNPVTSYPITLHTDGLAVSLIPNQGSTNTTGDFSALIKSRFVGSTTIGWTAGPLMGGNTVTFVTGAARSATSTVVTTPSATTADGSTVATIVGTIRDASSNPVQGQALTLTLSGGNNTIANANCVTDANGRCNFTATSTRAESKTAIIQAPGLQAKGLALFVSGPPSAAQSAIQSNTHITLVADGASAFLLTIKLADPLGNAVGGAPITMSSAIGSDQFAPPSGKTNASGLFTTQLSGMVVGTRTISAVNPNLTQQANFTFGLGPMSAATSTFVATPDAGLTADGVATSTLQAHIKDAQGRELPGVPVVLSSTGNNDHIANAAPVTDANGRISVSLTSTRAERKKVSLASGKIALATQVTFVAGSPNATVSSMVTTTGKPSAGPTGAAKMQVTVVDAYGNSCPNLPVTFSATGSTNTFSLAGGNTNAFGYLSTNLQTTLAETKTVSAQVGAITITQSVKFVAAAASAVNTMFTASPNSGIVANGVSSATLVATVRDAYNNDVAGQSVYIYVNDRNVTVVKRSGTTDASGVFTTTLVSSTAGSKSITLQAGAASKVTAVSFVAAPTSSLLSPQDVLDKIFAQPGQQNDEEMLAAIARAQWHNSGVQDALLVHIEDHDQQHWAQATQATKQLSILSFNRSGKVLCEETFALPMAPVSLMAQDVTGDGCSDIVIQTTAGRVVLVRDERGQFCMLPGLLQ